MRDKLLYIAVIILFALGVGVYIGMKLAKEKRVTHTEVVSFNRDSIRAIVYNEVAPIIADSIQSNIKPRWITSLVHDTIETKTVVTLYDSVVKPLDDYVAQAVTHTDRYSLWQEYKLTSKQFAHKLEYKHRLDTLIIAECRTTFFEDVVQYGKYTLIAVIAFLIGNNI